MKLEFIHNLNESSQYRTRQSFKGVTAREIADHAFMDTIALWIMYNEFEFAPAAMRYADKTMAYGSFKTYRQSGTDLYHTYHILSERNGTLIDADSADTVLLDRITFPTQQIKQFLGSVRNNKVAEASARQLLQSLERKLFISNSNYRSVRRLAQDWKKLSESQKSLVITRMLQFYRTHARRSEMYALLNKLAKSGSYEIEDAKNAEQSNKRSMKDVAKAAAAGAAAFTAGAYVGRRAGKGSV